MIQFLEESKKMGLELPGLELAKSLYDKTKELGYGRLGTQALYIALKEISENQTNSVYDKEVIAVIIIELFLLRGIQ